MQSHVSGAGFMLGWGQFVNGFVCHTVGSFRVYNLGISQYGGWIKERRD